LRDWLRRQQSGHEKSQSSIEWDDVVFEVDLLKSQEINLDYILELIFEQHRKVKGKSELIDGVRRVIRASLGQRAKESLVVDFINQTDLDQLGDQASVIEAFFTFAREELQREAQTLIEDENLNAEAARRYLATSLKRCRRRRHRTQCRLAKHEPTQSAVPEQKAARVPEDRGVCRKV